MRSSMRALETVWERLLELVADVIEVGGLFPQIASQGQLYFRLVEHAQRLHLRSFVRAELVEHRQKVGTEQSCSLLPPK